MASINPIAVYSSNALSLRAGRSSAQPEVDPIEEIARSRRQDEQELIEPILQGEWLEADDEPDSTLDDLLRRQSYQQFAGGRAAPQGQRAIDEYLNYAHLSGPGDLRSLVDDFA